MDTQLIRIVILLFDGYAALDVIGPYEVLSRLPGAKIYFAGYEKKGYRDTYGLELKADCAINEISGAEILLVPGGVGVDDSLKNKEIVTGIGRSTRQAVDGLGLLQVHWLLAEAGIYNGKNCHTHWRRKGS